MSSSEGEEFDVDNVSGDDSDDGYAPVKAKQAAKAKAPTVKSKAPASKAKVSTKPKAAPKKKVLVDHDDNADAMQIDEDEDEAGPSKAVAAPGKKKTASEMYQKLTQLEHILKRPDSYIGSIESVTAPMWTYDVDTKRMVHRDVTYVPGFFKIIDEILVNAADRKIVDPTMNTIKVTIDVDEGLISVYNNGNGIPIEMHSKEKIYVPEMIFGHLLSSSNYDDDEKKLTGGRNGYGAKLTNIYSTEFTLETADANSKQKYKQTWTNNMNTCGKAKITKNAKEDFTRVSFRPDLARFGMDSIDTDTASLLRKRVYDIAGTVKGVKVYLNDELVKIKTFKQYVELYLNSVQAQAEEKGGAAQPKPTIIYEQIDERWEIAFAVSEGSFQHVSFANSVSTTKGGNHVAVIADQISKFLLQTVSKKNKGATVKAAQIKNHMWIFVNALIENPTFDSQTKEQMTLQASKFGSKPTVSEEFMKKVQKSPIIDHILNWAQFKADQQIKKTDGNKRNRLTGLPKLSDANNAGTKNAKDCTLILTEGDSAKALAVAGLDVVGRDNFGVFPLRGKVLNVREAGHEQIMKNAEIQNIKKILGLQHSKEYKDTGGLRYGRLMLMTDQDHDGSHIKGLLINFLDHFYSSLLKVPEFLVEFVTPIVRVTKGSQRKDFFTMPEYETWVENTADSSKWTVKYYKGLGTSKDSDAREYFKHMSKHVIPFAELQNEDRGLIDMAFSKKKADERKDWLREFKPGTFLDHRLEEITYDDFINKELILFSMADNIRSIPSVVDGLKPGQRKIMWSVFKRNMKTEIKVAQLIGYVSEHSAYHHGEASLASTIINLAQHYVGSNNVNLLMPEGQFGTRHEGGKDHASARYIFTKPTPLARAIFHSGDDPLLNEQLDDGKPIEPEWYMPIVPTILLNGAEGIGTGWSTSIPCFNPVDVVNNIRRLMDGEEMEVMHPWWRGFTGEIKATGKNKYDVLGSVRKLDDTTLEITELPVHKWTNQFKTELDSMMEKNDGIKNYQEHHANANVHFVIQMTAKEMEKAEAQGLHDYFKLSGKLSTTNMMLFDFDGKIKKYDSPEAIVEEFYPVRLKYYQKRKDFLAGQLQNMFERLSNQARFIQMIVKKELTVSGRKKAAIVVDLRKHEFRPFPKVKDKKPKAADDAEAEEAAEEAAEDAAGTEGADTDFDYLLSMPIWNLTKEKIDKLLQQAADKEAELVALLELSPKQLWNTDLDNFLELWDETQVAWFKETASDPSKNGKGKGRKKQATLKTRKSIGGKGGDEDEDFKPIKATAAAKRGGAGPSKPAAKRAAAKKEEDDDDGVPPPPPKAKPQRKAAAAKKPLKDESDDDFEMGEPVPVAAKKKAGPAVKMDSDDEAPARVLKRKPAAVKDEEDDSDAEPPAKPPPSKRKAPAKITVDSEDEDDDDELVVIPDKGKGKAKAKPAPKRKSLDLEDDEEEDDPKPAAKKKKQVPVTDFFTKSTGSSSSEVPKAKAKTTMKERMKPASPPKKKAPPPKVIDSEDEDEMDFDVVPAKPPPKSTRPTRAPAKKYVDIDLSDDEDEGGGNTSLFDLDD